MFDDLELKLRHCVSGNTLFESLTEKRPWFLYNLGLLYCIWSYWELNN